MLCGLDCRSALTAGPSRCPPLSEDKVPILGQRAVDTMLHVMGAVTMGLGDGAGDTAATPPAPSHCVALFMVAASPTVPRPPSGHGAGGPEACPLELGVPHATLAFIGKVQQTLLGAGISVRTAVLPADPGVCTAAVEAASADPLVAGIIVGRPLPPGCSVMLACIAPSKDLDGAAPGGSVVSATAAGAAGVVQLLYRGPLLDRVVVIGHKGSVGSGVGVALEQAGIPWHGLGRVDVEGAGASGLGDLLQDATILLSAVGKAGLLTAAALAAHPRRLVVDVGWDGGIGDVHRDAYTAEGTTTFITPVPGGCGPLQMAVLLFRVAKACKCQGMDAGLTLLDVLHRAFGPQIGDVCGAGSTACDP